MRGLVVNEVVTVKPAHVFTMVDFFDMLFQVKKLRLNLFDLKFFDKSDRKTFRLSTVPAFPPYSIELRFLCCLKRAGVEASKAAFPHSPQLPARPRQTGNQRKWAR